MNARNLGSAWQVFVKRVRSNGRFQRKIWTMTVDWVIAVYLIVPAVVIGGLYYRGFWQGNVQWFSAIPDVFVILALYVYVWTGRLRLFVEKADQLFLRQKGAWMRSFMTWGSWYSFALTVLSAGMLFVILAPYFIVVQGMDVRTFGLAFLLVILSRWHMMLIRSLQRTTAKRIGRWLSLGFLFVAGGLLFGWTLLRMPQWALGMPLICLVLFISALFLWRMKINQRGNFLFDCIREEKHKWRYAKWVLNMSSASAAQMGVEPFMKQKAEHPRRSPWIFRQSKPLFQQRTPANILTETYVKSFLRNRQHLLDFGKIIGLCTFGVAYLPLTLKWIMWIISFFLIRQWLSGGWHEMMNSSFFKLFDWQEEDLNKARQKAVRLILIPGFLWVSIVLGLSVMFI